MLKKGISKRESREAYRLAEKLPPSFSRLKCLVPGRCAKAQRPFLFVTSGKPTRLGVKTRY